MTRRNSHSFPKNNENVVCVELLCTKVEDLVRMQQSEYGHTCYTQFLTTGTGTTVGASTSSRELAGHMQSTHTR